MDPVLNHVNTDTSEWHRMDTILNQFWCGMEWTQFWTVSAVAHRRGMEWIKFRTLSAVAYRRGLEWTQFWTLSAGKTSHSSQGIGHITSCLIGFIFVIFMFEYFAEMPNGCQAWVLRWTFQEHYTRVFQEIRYLLSSVYNKQQCISGRVMLVPSS